MCDQNRFFNMRIETKITILGVSTFVLTSIGFIISLYTIIKEEHLHKEFQTTHQLQHVFDINLDKKIIDVVIGLVCVISFLAMAFSILLLVGMKKNKAGFVVAYFGYGIMLTILMILSALLELLEKYWAIAISTMILSGIYIYCLTLVYNVYEMMQKGLKFGCNRHNLIENES